MKLKRVGVLSLAVLQGVIMVIMGFLIAILWVTLGSLMSSLSGGLMTPSGGIWTIILFPSIYGATGFIGGAIGALIYNLGAKMVGGVDLEFEHVQRFPESM